LSHFKILIFKQVALHLLKPTSKTQPRNKIHWTHFNQALAPR